LSDAEFKDYQAKKAIVNAAVQWNDLRLSEQVKHVRLFRDKDNNIVTMPVILLDPTQTGLNVLPMGRVGISDPAAVNTYARVYGLPCCGWPETTLGLVTHSTEMVQKGANLEAVRTPTIFRTASITVTGPTTIWTPAAGNKFRLMGGVITFGGPTLAAAAYEIIRFYDLATQMAIDFLAWVPQVAVDMHSIAFDLKPNGYLSIAADNAFRVGLTDNLAAGIIRITVWGTEEV